MKTLKESVQHNLKTFCGEAFHIIKKQNPRIRSIIVQYHSGNIYIGRQCRGGYKPVYFKSNQKEDIENTEGMDTFMEKQGVNAIIECWDEFRVHYPRLMQTKSINLFYNGNSTEIMVCKNRIGIIGAIKCSLFEKF